MRAQVLTGTKSEIAAAVARIDDEVRQVIAFVEEEPSSTPPPIPTDDIFAEMEPFTVHVGGADYSREALYTRLEGE
jgi:hypothetical protein